MSCWLLCRCCCGLEALLYQYDARHQNEREANNRRCPDVVDRVVCLTLFVVVDVSSYHNSVACGCGSVLRSQTFSDLNVQEAGGLAALSNSRC